MRPDFTDRDRDSAAAGWEASVREHERSLTVGARVRITLSPECEYCDGDGGDGMEGVIIATELPMDSDEYDFATETDPTVLAHHYCVRSGDMTWPNWSGYAAIELTVLDD